MSVARLERLLEAGEFVGVEHRAELSEHDLGVRVGKHARVALHEVVAVLVGVVQLEHKVVEHELGAHVEVLVQVVFGQLGGERLIGRLLDLHALEETSAVYSLLQQQQQQQKH